MAKAQDIMSHECTYCQAKDTTSLHFETKKPWIFGFQLSVAAGSYVYQLHKKPSTKNPLIINPIHQ